MTAASNQREFIPIAMDSLDYCALDMDLYMRAGRDPTMTLYRTRGLEFLPEDAARLTSQGVRFLYVKVTQHGAYRKMLANRLERLAADPAATTAQKTKSVRESCAKIIEEAMLLPGQPDAFDTFGEIGRLFTTWANKDGDGFTYLMDMSSHDYYTTTHMVNVGVGCGLLLRAVNPSDEAAFSAITIGGMLHDVGKRGVPEEILNKEGKLTDEEWSKIKTHPALGYDELVNNKTLPPVVAIMARDHHEHMNGKGYPNGRTGEDLSLEAKICAIVDVYDAITAARPYRGPIAPQDALKMMSEKRGTQFDPDLFDAWHNLIERLIKDDPSRAVKESAPGAVKPLDEMSASGHETNDVVVIQPARRGGRSMTKEKRRFERTPFQMPVEVTFIRQGKPMPVDPGQPFRAETIDLSRSGIGLCTEWPLSVGDIITVSLTDKTGKVVLKHCEVVRVRALKRGWLAGACFVEARALKAA
ncbi:MAG TPA: HD domain-containing phosphohydrolase [Phycisphaerales bacterium]|nr:HD domain-containing phosphohydrolase [Phycisphaerales bacterium]